MGTDGAKRVVVNSVGREIRTLEEIPPREGRRVQLTIDADLQKAAEDGFRLAGFNGAALIMDPRNGEVLTYASLPSYDPNDFSVGIDRATWTSLNTDKLKPLQNRVLQGRYSPGSIFKIVVATAALEEGVVTPDFRVTCNGGANFFGRFFKCHLKGGHGSVDMRHAIEKSCNVYFYTLGNMLGVDKIHKWAEKLGMVGKTGIDLPNEQDSIVPSTEWKRRRTGEKWYAGETISVSIGQGPILVTPLQTAVMMATIANGGKVVTPHLRRSAEPEPRRVELDARALQVVREGLWQVVKYGTAARSSVPGLEIAGKTGTVQVIAQSVGVDSEDLPFKYRDHAWFASFAPGTPGATPELVVVVFVEHGGSGSGAAAPIAKALYEVHFADALRRLQPA